MSTTWLTLMVAAGGRPDTALGMTSHSCTSSLTSWSLSASAEPPVLTSLMGSAASRFSRRLRGPPASAVGSISTTVEPAPTPAAGAVLRRMWGVHPLHVCAGRAADRRARTGFHAQPTSKRPHGCRDRGQCHRGAGRRHPQGARELDVQRWLYRTLGPRQAICR